MKYRAVIKKSDDWWIGWLIDLPGVNAQEKSRDELLESLRIGAEDMLATDIPFIADASSELSRKLSRYLHQGRFRIGVTQKLINVHLKYLWTAGFCPEPPHCPIDGIIRDIAGINYNWTSSDSVDEYLQAIAALKKLASAEGHSLAQWELESFRRREDEEL